MKMMQPFLSVGIPNNIINYLRISIKRGFFLFFLLFLGACSNEYHDHFYASSTQVSEGSGFLNSGSIEKISILPDQWVKQELITVIEHARDHIYLQIYILTDVDILDALIHARQRGIDVRVVLEGNPYMTPYVNNSAISLLKKWNVPYIFSDNDRFNFNHAKFLLVDGRYFVSTGNFTKTYFEKNRDFLATGSDYSIYTTLQQVFLADYAHKSVYLEHWIPSGLILSPVNARESIENLLKNSQSEIRIFVQTLTDESLLQILSKKQKEWLKISLCLGDIGNNSSLYEKYNLPYTIAKPYYLHGKMIFSDKKYIFLWSQNLTQNALEWNREVGIIFEPDIHDFSTLFLTFQRDCIFRKGK
jgi:cardiolipin synthase